MKRLTSLLVALVLAPLAGCAASRPDPDDEELQPEPEPTSFGIQLDDMARRKHIVVPGLSPELSNAVGRELSTPPDLVGALNGYATACGKGEAAGCYMLSHLDKPRFVKDDFKRQAALEPFETACAGDVPAGCHLAALVLDDETAAPVDPKAAMVAYEKACKLGFQPACVREASGFLFGPRAREKGAQERHVALRAAACKAGFPSGCRPVPARGYAGDLPRACELGDLDACLATATGPKAAAAKKRVRELGASIRAICDASGHVLSCSDVERSR